jgi:hypothetical protein
MAAHPDLDECHVPYTLNATTQPKFEKTRVINHTFFLSFVVDEYQIFDYASLDLVPKYLFL